jgi:hypothetical protein
MDKIKIVVEIGAGEKYCGECPLQNTAEDWCRAFGVDAIDGLLEWSIEKRSYIRCPECLAAEQKYKRLTEKAMDHRQMELLRIWVRAEIDYAIASLEEDETGNRVSASGERIEAQMRFAAACEALRDDVDGCK